VGVDKMNILGYEISQKTEKEILEITKDFKKTVDYDDIAALGLGGYGAVYYKDSKKYIVLLKLGLSQEDFETNILCELNHIRQTEEKYPYTELKKSDIVKNETNPMFFDYLNHSLCSSILDLDVMKRLEALGHSIKLYTGNRLNQILKIDLKSNMDDKYNYASFSIQYIMFVQTAQNDEIKTAQEFLDKNFNGIASSLTPTIEKIKKIGYHTPENAFKCMLTLIDTFNLWDVCYAVFRDTSVKTRKSCQRYFEENK
jgi:hypothetical protein